MCILKYINIKDYIKTILKIKAAQSQNKYITSLFIFYFLIF